MKLSVQEQEIRRLKKNFKQLSDSVLAYIYVLRTNIATADPTQLEEKLSLLEEQNDLAREKLGLGCAQEGKLEALKLLMRGISDE